MLANQASKSSSPQAIVTSLARVVILGGLLSTIITLAVVVTDTPQSSVAVKVTSASPVAAHSSLKPV